MSSFLSEVVSCNAGKMQQIISSLCRNSCSSSPEATSPFQSIRSKRLLVRMYLAKASAQMFVYLNVLNSRYVTLVFFKRASANCTPSLPSLSPKRRMLKGLPSSGRIEASLVRTLAQNSRNADESKALPSSTVLSTVESFETLMLSYFCRNSLFPLLDEITAQFCRIESSISKVGPTNITLHWTAGSFECYAIVSLRACIELPNFTRKLSHDESS
jgi:hypothetical protein